MTAVTKNIAIIVFGAALCIALSIFLLKPALGSLAEANRTLSAKATEVANLQQQVLAYQTAESDLNHATNKQEISDAILPREQLVSAIKEVEAAATSTSTSESMLIQDPEAVPVDPNATANTNKPDNTIPGFGGVKQIPYTLNVVGFYSSLTDFISYLDHLPNFTEVSKLEFTAETTTNSNQAPVHTGRILGTINGVFFVEQ